MSQRFLTLLLATGVACYSRTEPTAIGDRASSMTLIGVWDVQMQLDTNYALALRRPSARVICGTIGFVGVGEAIEAGNLQPLLRGVYDLPLSRLGLNWEGSDRFPVASGLVRSISSATSQWTDSIDVTVNPESVELIKLSGRRSGDVISGRWSAESARGYASGSFHMWRHEAHDPDVMQRCGSQ